MQCLRFARISKYADEEYYTCHTPGVRNTQVARQYLLLSGAEAQQSVVKRGEKAG